MKTIISVGDNDIAQVFSCPECGSKRLEKVEGGIEKTSSLCRIDREGENFLTSQEETSGGFVLNYQCANCEWTVFHGDDPCEKDSDLYEALKQNDAIRREGIDTAEEVPS